MEGKRGRLRHSYIDLIKDKEAVAVYKEVKETALES